MTSKFSLIIREPNISNATSVVDDSILPAVKPPLPISFARCLISLLGLNVHMSQVHKEQLTAVDNALPNRAGLDIEIFGTEGIPEEVAVQHRQRVLQNFHQAEAERRAATGNPPPGGSGSAQAKKPKFETPSEMKARLAAHKQKVTEQTSGGSSGGVTPVGAGQSQSPAMGQTSNGFVSFSCPE